MKTPLAIALLNAASILVATGSAAERYAPSATMPVRGSARSAAGFGPQTRGEHQFPLQLRRLPPVARAVAANPKSNAPTRPSGVVDGTWQEDGRHIIINLNGQQLRLEKSNSPSGNLPPRTRSQGGEVQGRLSHRGRPLVNCAVALLPLTKSRNSYEVNGSVEPLVHHTDQNGVYYFQDVPPGPYKLTWLPEGQRQWIRRVEFRPDMRVKPAEISRVNEIRVSLRTVN